MSDNFFILCILSIFILQSERSNIHSHLAGTPDGLGNFLNIYDFDKLCFILYIIVFAVMLFAKIFGG